MSRIGIIAGNGRFPFLALQGARSLGHDVTVVAVKEEAFADLEQAAREAHASYHSVSLGHLGKCIKILRQDGVSQAVMAGQVFVAGDGGHRMRIILRRRCTTSI